MDELIIRNKETELVSALHYLGEDLPDPFWQRDTEQTEAAEQLKDILGVLSEKEQRILIGHFAYGLSYRDLAALMDLTPAAVQKTVSRLRQRIKKSGKEAQA